MTFFESLLLLLLAAIALLQVARRLALPYPAMLAAAGVVVALIPGSPEIPLKPSTCLALFIAPALVDAAYDFPPGAMRRLLAPLFTLAVLGVIVTAAIVACIGTVWLGLPIAAAVVLGAIVAPPDAAAATAVLRGLSLPRNTDSVLQGESLFNDATALMLFSGGLTVLASGGLRPGVALQLGLAVPGGMLLGYVCALAAWFLNRVVKDTLGGNLLQFVLAYLIWITADRLHLSAVLCTITFAMTLARQTSLTDFDARMRVHSFAVWTSVVFSLNVFAFLLMGMQARAIVRGMPSAHLREALVFAGIVVAAVIITRMLMVLAFNRTQALLARRRGQAEPATVRQALFAGWSGMRGFVTMATAFALPDSFPHRDTVVLTAFCVVLATLVVQGSTLRPLVRWLQLDRSESAVRELVAARAAMARVALASVGREGGPVADNLRYQFALRQQACAEQGPSASLDQMRSLGLRAVQAQREELEQIRVRDEIGVTGYLGLQEQLDWHELTLLRDADRRIEEI